MLEHCCLPELTIWPGWTDGLDSVKGSLQFQVPPSPRKSCEVEDESPESGCHWALTSLTWRNPQGSASAKGSLLCSLVLQAFLAVPQLHLIDAIKFIKALFVCWFAQMHDAGGSLHLLLGDMVHYVPPFWLCVPFLVNFCCAKFLEEHSRIGTPPVFC